MSAGNLFTTKQSAFGLQTKVINSAYTVRVGGDNDNFQVDRVIKIVDPTADFEIDVPAGVYPGQQLLITLTAHATSAKKATIDLATGTDVILGDLGDYTSLEWVNATTGWIPLSAVTD